MSDQSDLVDMVLGMTKTAREHELNNVRMALENHAAAGISLAELLRSGLYDAAKAFQPLIVRAGSSEEMANAMGATHRIRIVADVMVALLEGADPAARLTDYARDHEEAEAASRDQLALLTSNSRTTTH